MSKTTTTSSRRYFGIETQGVLSLETKDGGVTWSPVNPVCGKYSALVHTVVCFSSRTARELWLTNSAGMGLQDVVSRKPVSSSKLTATELRTAVALNTYEY